MSKQLLVVPWRPQGEDRIASWAFLRPMYAALDIEMVEADNGKGTDERMDVPGTLNDVLRGRDDWTSVALVDADVWVRPPDRLFDMLDMAEETGDAVTPSHMYFLPREHTERLVTGDLEAVEGWTIPRTMSWGAVWALSRKVYEDFGPFPEAPDGKRNNFDTHWMRPVQDAGRRQRMSVLCYHLHHERPDREGPINQEQELVWAVTGLGTPPGSYKYRTALRELRNRGIIAS